MGHLQEDALLDALQGRLDPALERHITDCGTCAARIEAWREVVADLGEMETLALDDGERHKLRALFRAFGPATEPRRSWLAALVRATSAAPAAVRGSASPQLSDLRAGPFRVILELRRSHDRAKCSVYGQVETADGEAVEAGAVVAVDDSGVLRETRLDPFGEFALDDLSPRPTSVVIELADDRIVIEDVGLGQDEVS